MVSDRTHRTLRAWKGGLLIMGVSVITAFVPKALSGEMPSFQNLFSMPTLVVLGLGLLLTLLYALWQTRSSEENPEAIKEQVSQLQSELRSQVQTRSYGARSKLIAAPLTELDLEMTPRVGWVRDPRLTKPEPLSEESADIVAAFTSSKRRLLIVGEPGAGKTTAAYALIEHLDETEGDERVPLLVNLSAWETQDTFEAFLVDYLVSEVGFQIRKPAVASAFIHSRRYNLILDGLDEIPAGLRAHFSKRLDKFLEGLPSEVAVVVTCRTQEYQELREAYTPSTSLGLDQEGLGLVQAVEIRPLTNEQLDSAFTELAKIDRDWETFLTQRHLKATQRARDLLSNPLFLNLAVIGRLRPHALLKCDEDQDLRALVLDRYLDRVLLVDQSQREPKDVRRYLTWIARFLNGAEVSPFGLKTTDATVFDLADLTPPDPPKRYWLFAALVVAPVVGLVLPLVEWLFEWLVLGLLPRGPGSQLVDGLVVVLSLGLGWGLVGGLLTRPYRLFEVLVVGLLFGVFFGLDERLYGELDSQLLGSLMGGLVVGLLAGWPYKLSAVSSRLTPAWPSTRRQLLAFFGSAGRGMFRRLVRGLIFGLVFGLVFGLGSRLIEVLGGGRGSRLIEVLFGGLFGGLLFGVFFGLGWGLVGGLAEGLVESRSVFITSRTPKEARSRSLVAALIWLVFGLVVGLVVVLGLELVFGLGLGLVVALVVGLLFGVFFGLGLGLRNGGWFVVLQKVAHRRLARVGNLPPRPADFLEWGIERQIFRRVGGGVRFRHSLIQQHLAGTPPGYPPPPQPSQDVSEGQPPLHSLPCKKLAGPKGRIGWRQLEGPGVVAAALAGVVLVLYSLFRLLLETLGVPSTEEGTPLFYFNWVTYTAGYMGALGGLVGLHAQQVGSYGKLGWTGFFLALTGTTLFIAHALIRFLTLGPGLVSTDSVLALLLLLSGYLLLGIATIKAEALPVWCGIVIIIAVLASIAVLALTVTFLAGAYGNVFQAVLGLMWLALSYALLAKRRAAI